VAAEKPQVLGLIAGGGALPLEIARSARRAGRRAAAVAFHGHTDARIADDVEQLTWIHPGEVESGIAALLAAGVEEAILLGTVPKELIYREPAELRLDDLAGGALASLPDRRDTTILSVVAEVLETRGIRLLPQWALAPELLAGEGPLGVAHPTPEQEADIAFGLPIARTLAALDVGQTLIVHRGAVLAVEAMEGTDAAIRRAGSLARGGVVVKVARPSQDPRFDVPTIGPRTLDVLEEARIGALAFEAGATIVLEREVLAREADARRIAFVGVDPARFGERGS
jgi:DUF1009 family protein